jgi:sterol desaturase/sphingolipid hydroxylase (fatty acid hydroxylase superfamily)
MILYDTFFKSRKVPAWWLRFTNGNPVVASVIAIAGLAWICLLLSHIVSSAEKHGQGELIETIGIISWSEDLIKNAHSLRATYHNLFPSEVRELVSELYSNIALYLVVPFLLLLEFLFPCKPSQPLISKGFLQDAVWFVAIAPAKIFILFPVTSLLRSVFNDYLPFLVIDAASVWPMFLKIIAALLLGELLAWFNHFIRHKIRTLWLFHAIHHSQKEMNVFTDDRAHVVDLLVGSLFTYIPFFIFQVPNLYALTVISMYMAIHNRFIHANLKINLGWLGWLLASPQFHRVHHSADITHRDKNFGRTLSIFDHLFGTAYPSRHVYPETGIDDMRYPDEQKLRVRQLPVNWIRQTFYPFVQLFRKRLGSLRIRMVRKNISSRHNRTISKRVDISKQKV